MAKYKIHKITEEDIEILSAKGINTSVLENRPTYCLVNRKNGTIGEKEGRLVIYEADFKAGEKKACKKNPVANDYALAVAACGVFTAAGYKVDCVELGKKDKKIPNFDGVLGFSAIVVPDEMREQAKHTAKSIFGKVNKACKIAQEVLEEAKNAELDFGLTRIEIPGYRSGNQTIAELWEERMREEAAGMDADIEDFDFDEDEYDEDYDEDEEEEEY